MKLYDIKIDDLSGEATRELIAVHIQGMHQHSPPENVCGLDLDGLDDPSITVWSAWDGKALAGIGALKELGGGVGELKSMRTSTDYLRQGVASALLEHIIEQAHVRGLHRLSLETGSGDAFEPALALYRKRGFVNGAVFSDHVASEFNQFLHMELEV